MTSLFCLLCEKSFPDAQLSHHIASVHFGFLPFACPSCDFTAAEKVEVLQHAGEQGHFPRVIDRSPYVGLLTSLIAKHCRAFEQSGNFEKVLSELSSEITMDKDKHYMAIERMKKHIGRMVQHVENRMNDPDAEVIPCWMEKLVEEFQCTTVRAVDFRDDDLRGIFSDLNAKPNMPPIAVSSSLVMYVVVRRDLLSALRQGYDAATTVLWTHKDDANVKEYMANVDCMRKVFLEVESADQLTQLAQALAENHIDHKLWIEQPENVATCIAIKPYAKEVVHKFVEQLKLFT